MSFRTVLFLAALAMIAAGASLLSQSAAMPEWTDEAKAQAVQMWDPPEEETGPVADAYNRHWIKTIKDLRTGKWPYHDAGMALIVFAVSLTASVLVLKINTMADVAALKTPGHAISIYGFGIAGWFLYWVSAIMALLEGVNRSEFPPWFSSQLTMIVMIACFAAVGAMVLGTLAFFILHKAPLPASLWIWRKDMPGHDWFYTIGAGVLLLVGLEILRETYCYGHWLAIPAVFLCVYATLATRAAGIAKSA
jgi:hypothetical protein